MKTMATPFGAKSLGEHRRNAEKLKSTGFANEAISEYRLHIEERLADSSRPASENPWFYEILVGDLYLSMDRPKDALDSYLKAYSKGVMVEFVIDRVRQISAYFEARGDYESALKLLEQYRDLDDLLFDWDIDRLHKLQVKQEQANEWAVDPAN